MAVVWFLEVQLLGVEFFEPFVEPGVKDLRVPIDSMPKFGWLWQGSIVNPVFNGSDGDTQRLCDGLLVERLEGG